MSFTAVPGLAKTEAGDRRVDVVELEAICDALGVSFPGFVRRYSECE